MKVSDFITEFLVQKGIRSVFELSGGMITHILDSLSKNSEIKIVTMHHEQAAAFAAEGYARVTGLPGIALATSGPGATNLLTGIGSCYFDSTPAIFITGQVNRHELKGDREIRQLGFQETDIIAMAIPITKACFHIKEAEEIPAVFEKAFTIALKGRPGPVLIDLPMDLQRAQINPTTSKIKKSLILEVEKDKIQNLIKDIKLAKKPLILAGRGVKASNTQEHFDYFVEKTKIPVITTLLGLDTIPFNSKYRVGFIGSYGNRWSNIAFGKCDLLIVLGSRLDIRQTGADTKFIENRRIYHIDCEKGEINNRVKGCEAIVTDLNDFFDKFEEYANEDSFLLSKKWLKQINDLRITWPDIKELSPKGINPNVFMHSLSSKSHNAKAYLADVGSHQMWAAQSLELNRGQYFLTSGGMGAMGFSLPAGIGVSIALDNEPVVVIIGDGCMQINIQELQTIVRNKLPIKIVVINNRNLGMIRQFQDSYFESRYQSTFWGYNAPDFAKVATAYGIEAMTIEDSNEVKEGVNWLWDDKGLIKAKLLQVMVDPYTNTYPKIAFGRPITEMEPFSKPIEMEGT